MINYVITFENLDESYLITSKHSTDNAQGYINLAKDIYKTIRNTPELERFADDLEIETINKLYKL